MRRDERGKQTEEIRIRAAGECLVLCALCVTPDSCIWVHLTAVLCLHCDACIHSSFLRANGQNRDAVTILISFFLFLGSRDRLTLLLLGISHSPTFSPPLILIPSCNHRFIDGSSERQLVLLLISDHFIRHPPFSYILLMKAHLNTDKTHFSWKGNTHSSDNDETSD